MSAPLTAIDLGLVEEGIEIGKKIMAEVIANYPTAGKGAAAAAPPGPRSLGRAHESRRPKAKLKWSRPSAAATSTR